MMVLHHKHSLALIDLNPKYPYVEAIYDDDEDLIIKQAFQSSCDRCHQEITYYHRYYYKCDQCDCSLHKLCGEIPIKLQHASHTAHSLTLFLDKSQGPCHICRSTSQHKQLRYHCSRCMFNICVGCAMGEVQYLTIYHPSHQHPLNPTCRQRQTLVECDACGEEHKGVFYECFTCFSSLMHNDCVFKPKRLLIQSVTSGRFFHTHQLILAYLFPKEYQKAKFDPTCRVCENSFSGSENHWVYMCEKCRYYVHLKCTNLRFEPHDSGAVETSKNYQDEPRVLHLPFFDQTQNMFTKLFFKETNAKSITHVSHQHPLVLVDKMSKVKDLCNGCLRPINDMPFYKCNTYECKFVLHELCTRLPWILQGHADQAGHCLLLEQKAIRPDVTCLVCNRLCKGFFYSCSGCFDYYKVDISCALVIETITHKSHPFHLLSRVEKRLLKDYCHMCLSDFKSKEESSFSCNICNFHLHRECALLLPETIRHKYDKHLMTLSYSPIENHEGDYFCEVCEEELNPYISFYHCHECAQSIHSTCAKLQPLPKSYTLYGLNEKGDSESTNEDIIHDHPLSFFKGTLSNRGCSYCHLSMEKDFILECRQCKFAIHAYHLDKGGNNMDDINDVGVGIGLELRYPGHEHIVWFTYGTYQKHIRDPGHKYKANTRPVGCSDCSLPFRADDGVFACDYCGFRIHAYHIHKRDISSFWRRRRRSVLPNIIYM